MAGYSNPSDAHEIELLLRFKITAHSARGYETLWAQDGGMAVVRWNGPLGDYTPLVDGVQIGQAVDGDVLRMEIKGSTIKVYKNGSLKATVSNTTWTDGQPGVGFWPLPGATLTSYGWHSYTAGDSLATSSESSMAAPPAAFCDDPQPNPANRSTLIRYGLASPGTVSITLHDISGKAIKTLVREYGKAGNYDVALSADGIPPGVYFVAAKIGAFNKTAKVLFLK